MKLSKDNLKKETQIKALQPPEQLMAGFLDFAKEIKQKCIEIGSKLSEEELEDIFNNSFSGKVRTLFFLWINDLNRIIEGINIILSDLLELRHDKNSLKGNPIIRSEFLFQAFFGEFFRMREISKIFLADLTKSGLFGNKSKETFVGFYFKVFEWVYEIRNNIIHRGVNVKDENFDINYSFLDFLSKKEKTKFINLIKRTNTRENTVEIQCAFYMVAILNIMEQYIKFQEFLNNMLADLIIAFEKIVVNINVSKNIE